MNQELTPTGNALEAIEYELARDPRIKSPNTVRGYRRDLAAFEDWRQGRAMTKLLVEAYAASLLAGGKSPATINRALAAVRWWARKVADLAFEQPMDKERREEIVTHATRVASISDVPREDQDADPTGRHIEPGELQSLMGTCASDAGPAGVRDAAIIAVAWNTGLRRFELAALELAALNWTDEDEATITVRGKRGKVRPAYIFNGAGGALRDWLAIRGEEPGPLFCAINRGGNLRQAGVSGEALAQMLEKRRQQAGVKMLTWHDFRRTFAGNLLDNGADLVTTQKLMGHSSPTTTARYDRRPERTRRKAAASLHVPYQRSEPDNEQDTTAQS